MSTTTTAIVAPKAAGRGRDPFIDLLRAGAIATVAVGHWIMPVFALHNGVLTAGNSLATPSWWLLTWFAQVMPVFFIAGGAANVHSYTAALRRGDNARTWLAARIRRLASPVVPLLAVWLVVPSILRDSGVPASAVALGAGVAGQLLWFLAVYLLTVAATPLMYVAETRWGLRVPVALGIAAIGVDLLRFNGLPMAGYLNEALVWLAVQQLGIGYATGRFAGLTRRGALMLGFGGIAATAVLVLFGPYPASMVGLPGQAVSNMSPATVCLLTLGVGQFGFLLAMRDRLARAMDRSRFLRALRDRCMTVYLWHMSAMVAVAGIAVLGFGYVTPAPGSVAWLVVTPLWVAGLAVVLRLLVRVFGRFEAVSGSDGRPGGVRLGVALGAVFAGLLGIAAFGFASPLPALASAITLVTGVWLVSPGLRDRLFGKLIDATIGQLDRRDR